MMVQLIINGLTLPYASNDKYQCYPSPLMEQVEMISGRMVQEMRGTVQMIHYEYDYMPDETWRTLQATLRGSDSFPVFYLPDNGSELVNGTFLTTEMQNPTFAFGRNNKAYWHNISFTLREVKPHD